MLAVHHEAGELAHAFRPSLFSGERRVVVEGSALKWTCRDAVQEVPLSSIRRVQVYHAPASGGRTIRRTILRLVDGRKLVLQSNHFVRLGSFEDRVESYSRFLHDLIGRLRLANPSAEVLIGPPTALWVTYWVLLVASVGILAAGLLLWLIGDFPASAAASFALVLGFLPLSWRVVRAGRARKVDLTVATDELPD